jgi:hypothetical protein
VLHKFTKPFVQINRMTSLVCGFPPHHKPGSAKGVCSIFQ